MIIVFKHLHYYSDPGTAMLYFKHIFKLGQG